MALDINLIMAKHRLTVTPNAKQFIDTDRAWMTWKSELKGGMHASDLYYGESPLAAVLCWVRNNT